QPLPRVTERDPDYMEACPPGKCARSPRGERATLTPRIAHGTRPLMARDLVIGALRLGARPAVVAAAGEADLDALVAADAADLLELRADLFDDPTPDGILAAIERLPPARRPIVFTARAAA